MSPARASTRLCLSTTQTRESAYFKPARMRSISGEGVITVPNSASSFVFAVPNAYCFNRLALSSTSTIENAKPPVVIDSGKRSSML